MANDAPTAVVTGASGLLGSRLCRHLAGRGYRVRALMRRPEAAPNRLSRPGIEFGLCDLPGKIEAESLIGADHLIHCAYATHARSRSEAEQVNESGTRALIELARHHGVGKFVFISSLSAAPDAPSYYARSKHRLESLMDPDRDLVIRPGLILAAGDGRGLISRLLSSMRTLHVVPLFGGGHQPLQTVHVEDLCEAVSRALARGLSGVLSVAEAQPITLRRFFELVAERLELRCLFVPLPFDLLLVVLRSMEAARLPLPLRSENLLGLKALRYVPVEADLARLDLNLRSAGESLADLFPSGEDCSAS